MPCLYLLVIACVSAAEFHVTASEKSIQMTKKLGAAFHNAGPNTFTLHQINHNGNSTPKLMFKCKTHTKNDGKR